MNNYLVKHTYWSLMFTAIVSLLVSCDTSRIFKSGLKPTEVIDLQYLQPISFISLFDAGYKMKFNDSISKRSATVLEQVIRDNKNNLPVTGLLNIVDSQTRKTVNKEIETLCFTASQQRNISNLAISPLLDSLLEKNGKRFGLLTIADGYTRSKKNYRNKKAQEITAGILLGVSGYSSARSGYTLYVMIVDARENNIAFFRTSRVDDKSPLKEAGFIERLRVIFEGFYLKRDNSYH